MLISLLLILVLCICLFDTLSLLFCILFNNINSGKTSDEDS